MRKTTPATAAAPDDSAITLNLNAAQLKALGLHKLPAQGAQLQLRATAIVAPAHDADDASDTDHDAGADAHGGDMDADDTGQGEHEDQSDQQAEAGHTAALTLHLSGLKLTQAHQAPDKVLYGSGD